MNFHDQLGNFQGEGKMVDFSENLNILANYSMQKGKSPFKLTQRGHESGN